MRYYDETTQTYKELSIKALDSMPVGSIVDFDGQASDIPTGWEEEDNVLYENSSGSNGTIILSDSAFNYSKIDIIYAAGTDYSPTVMTTYPKYSASWNMIWNWQESDWGGILGQKITYTTTGTTYQIARGTTYYVGGSYQGWSNFWSSYSDGIKIFKVIGYK